ncbi:MAG: FtsX-like permease family protein [Chitinivibrionales bacterium]|nr:FtsX-like permease family protein [Chitinivibrionales bacterium]
MEWFIALRYLRGKRKIGFISFISYISAAGVFLGSFVLVVALSVANGFEREVRDRIIGIFADARILQYFSRPIEAYDSLRLKVLEHPDVTAASPYISGKGLIEHEGVQEGNLIMGIDDSLEMTVTDLHSTVLIGEFKLDSAVSKDGDTLPGVLIGMGLANKLGVRTGSEVILGTIPAVEDQMDIMSSVRAGKFVVTGIFETGMYEYDLNLVYISIASAQELFDLKGVEGIQIKTTDLFHADRISQDVVEHVEGYPYRAVDWKSQNKSLFKWMKLERLIIFIVISLIIVVAAFNIICSLVMMIMEKRREIGILMGMGTTSGTIMKIFMLNGTIIGAIGSTIGVAAGVILCYIQYRYQLIPLPGDIYFITTLPIFIRPNDIWSIYLAANCICFLATLYPAWKASRILPAESLRIE